jgi:homoserine kinase
MIHMTAHYTISVPATTANLGPGYDRLGLALNLHLVTRAVPSDQWKVNPHGEGSHLLDTCDQNLIARAFIAACEHNGWHARPMLVESDNPIPIARGLGSSAAAIVTGMALAQLTNTGDIEKDKLFHEAAAMEGHADNVAAAVYGGLQELIPAKDSLSAAGRDIADNIKIMLVIPKQMKSTAELREIVPATIAPHLQKKTNEALQQVLAGLAAGKPDQLRFSEQDHRHQPYRLAMLPDSKAIFELLRDIPGIAGTFLSGAGTTVAAWIIKEAKPVAEVEQRLSAIKIEAVVKLVSPDFDGVKGNVIHE